MEERGGGGDTNTDRRDCIVGKVHDEKVKISKTKTLNLYLVRQGGTLLQSDAGKQSSS